jgi:protein-L-isoaspartate(D-aspartate) O-methyltransferase
LQLHDRYTGASTDRQRRRHHAAIDARFAANLAFSTTLPHKAAHARRHDAGRGRGMIDFAEARRMMVDGQVRTSDVTDLRVLAAMLDVPRERFVPPDKQALAYLDLDVPVLPGVGGRRPRCLLKPMVLAKLVQAADIRGTDHILDVGCATGYASAVLARLGQSVVALEEDAQLARAAKLALAEAGARNVTVVTGPLPQGAPDRAPYDVIMLDGASEVAPQMLLAQLNDGGRLVCVLSQGPIGKATIYRRSGAGHVGAQPLFDAAAPLLPGFAKPAEFVF